MTGLLQSLVVAALAAIPVVEIALASPLPELFVSLAAHGRKSLSLLASKRISDHWKERMLPVYAWNMLRASLLVLAWLMCLIIVFALGLGAGDWLFAGRFPGVEVFERLDYMLFSFLIAAIYLGARPYIFRHV